MRRLIAEGATDVRRARSRDRAGRVDQEDRPQRDGGQRGVTGRAGGLAALARHAMALIIGIGIDMTEPRRPHRARDRRVTRNRPCDRAAARRRRGRTWSRRREPRMRASVVDEIAAAGRTRPRRCRSTSSSAGAADTAVAATLEQARAYRRPRQQRGHHARPVDAAHEARRLGRGDRDQPDGGLRADAGGAQADDPAARGPDHLHQLGGRPERQRGAGELRRVEGRPDRVREVGRAGSGVARHHGQRGGARV